MATSPPYAGSPPGSGTPISRKRPSLSTQITASKRRKPSTAGPSHLRQTSFPPEEYPRDARSPSADSAAIGSVISGVGKRSKGAKNGSLIATGSRVNGASRAVSGSLIEGGGAEDDVDDEDDEGGGEGNLQGEEGDEEEREKEANALRCELLMTCRCYRTGLMR
jgi:transcription initiation factor TFIID subunit 11